eukprot:1327904-Pleurochrysis_carterae.AAC.3
MSTSAGVLQRCVATGGRWRIWAVQSGDLDIGRIHFVRRPLSPSVFFFQFMVLSRLSRGSIVDHSHFLWSASSRESAERRARLARAPPTFDCAGAKSAARVVRLSQQLERHAQRVYADSEHYLVPCVAAHATAAEQEAFNQAVVKSAPSRPIGVPVESVAISMWSLAHHDRCMPIC